MKHSLTVALILLAFPSSASPTTEKFYVKPSIGFEISDQSVSPAYNGSLSLGYNLNKSFSTELSLNFYGVNQSFAVGTQDDFSIQTKNKVFSLLWNQYYNFDTKSKITPYIMFGAGISSYCLALQRKSAVETLPSGDITFKVLKATDIKSSYFAYQLGAGLKLDAGDKISFDVGYRMINIKSPFITSNHYSSGGTSTTYYDVKFQTKYSHSLILGVSYSF